MMRKLIGIAIVLGAFFALCSFTASVFAATLVANPEACDYYLVSGLPGQATAVNVAGDSTGKTGFSLDLAPYTPASATATTVTVQCCDNTTASQAGGCSPASSPLAFTFLPVPAAPSGLGLK